MAQLHALSGVARAGASRSGAHSGKVFVSVAGVQYATAGTVTGARIPAASLSIRDTAYEEPSTAQATTIGFGPYIGDDVVITLGSINNRVREFGGQIIRLTHFPLTSDLDNQETDALSISMIDYTWGLDRKLVTGRWTGSATAIFESLISTYAPSGYTSRIEAGMPTVTGGITFTQEPLPAALTRLAERVGVVWYCDYNKVVRAYTDVSGESNPASLTPTHSTLSDISYERDLSQVVTRVSVEGGGGAALESVSPGETSLPVTVGDWYDSSGGYVVSGPQRITYTSRTLGGGGALVGPGARPSSAPSAALVSGGGVDTGLHAYAVTFATATGESIAGPTVSITTGAVVPPATAPSPGLAEVGTGPEAGSHDYVTTFVTSAGETTAGTTSGAVVTTVPTVANPTAAPSGAFGNSGTPLPLPAGGTWKWAYTFVTALGETLPSPVVTDSWPGAGAACYVLIIPLGGAGVTARKVYRTVEGAAQLKLVDTVSDNTTEYYIDRVLDGDLGANAPSSNTATYNKRTVPLSAIPIGSSLVTSRKIYRRFNGTGTFKLLTTIANNTATTYTDTTANASLGAAAPTANTALANQVALTNIPIGAATVTARKIYRTTIDAPSQLQLVTTIGDNTTTTYNDTTADGALGANVPTSDASGLPQPDGQVDAQSTSLVVSGSSAFSASGGWAIVGNGAQVIRYTGIGTGTLTGIPATGVGAIAASIGYNSTITAAPMLTGIPASGAGSIQYEILRGDDVNILEVRNDPSAQYTLAALVGGDGIQEEYVQDRRLAKTEAQSRGDAILSLRSSHIVTVRYTCRDINSKAGRTVTVALPGHPFFLTGDFLIQSATETFTLTNPQIPPTFVVEASSARFTFEQLLRRARN